MPVRFVDEQVSGPFAFWWREHVFTPLGAVVDRLVLTAYLEGLIRQRSSWLRQALERDTEPGPAGPLTSRGRGG